jgi:predicted dehydrogenase
VDNFHGLGALAAVCDSSASARAVLSARYPDVRWSGEVRDLLKDSELTGVAIVMPAKTHGALVRRSLQAGKDVFVEKPFCLDTDEGERLVQLSQHHGRLLMFGQPAVMPPGRSEAARAGACRRAWVHPVHVLQAASRYRETQSD